MLLDELPGFGILRGPVDDAGDPAAIAGMYMLMEDYNSACSPGC